MTIGIDIGGTKIAGGVVAPDGQVLTLTRADTPAYDATRTRGVIVDMIRELGAAHQVTAVGVGAAGWIDATRDRVRFAPHLAWRDEPLRDHVAAAVGLPVAVENDANAAAWAEFRFGAGQAAGESMALITVGTGIGGGLILGGRLLRGAHGFAGEPGHQLAVPDGLPCGCGRRGCLEQYASGQALVRLAQQAAVEQPAAAEGLLELAGGSPEQITGPLVTTAARAGDKLAREAFEQIGWWLGSCLADLVQLLDPRLLVVGGGVAEAGELLLAPARDAYQRALSQRGELPAASIRPAQLGNVAGVVGAADLARELI
ncbi:ROK family glucokinase [Natronosporangium hydrolyticum]|uniref:Glucokinase n=1 Tax=Natronosporangium hydrolyticum TaxID=2811111 RepID=A0A895YT18_9ACTN|nr:ROK family glucokinase [Natronosporangium hydrolyticum]